MVDGKKMVYRYHGYTMPPEPLTLYYIDDPKKVFPGDNINNYRRDMAGLWRALIYIIPLIDADTEQPVHMIYFNRIF